MRRRMRRPASRTSSSFDPRFRALPARFRHFITIFDHAKANISMNRQIPEERGGLLFRELEILYRVYRFPH